jgi:3-hydroxybutyryl-CoA dehydrogenase
VTIQKMGVVGAGLMGSEIALVFALAGKDVLLSDTNEANVARARDNLAKILQKGVQRGFYSADQERQALARIRPARDLASYADRDMVIEAVFEEERVKAETFRALDGICPPQCILASNTSSISISGLASHVQADRRRRFLGTHFFSPVSRMKLVEVIPGLDTDETTIETTLAVCREAGNRVLHAFMIEAVRLVEEGVATPEDIDLACKLGLGHPIGPFELMDATQLSLSLQVENILQGAYGERFLPRPLLKQMVQAGYNGKRAGRGWYRYGDKKQDR